jgi:hypothetical protein
MIKAIVALSMFAFATAASAETLTLAPKYDCTGTSPDGSKYHGTVTIKILSDTTFAIKWVIGDTVYNGYGMRRNDAIAATYTSDGEPGLAIYKVDADGLDGLWTIKGQAGNGTEHLTPVK